MIAALIRQDPALRGLPPWLSVTAGVGTALLGALSVLLYAAAARGAPPDPDLHFTFSFTVVWLSMAVFLLSPGARTRASDFTLGLPIEARSLATLHSLAVLLSSLAAWALLIGILLIGTRVVKAFGAPDILPGPRILDLALYLPAGFCLVIAVLHAPAPEQRTLPMGRPYAGLWALTVLGGLVVTLGLTHLPLVFVSTLPLAAAAVLWWSRRQAPLTLLVAPREAVLEPGPAAANGETAWVASRRPHSGIAYRWFLFRTVHRATMKKTALPVIGYPAILVLGAALSGVFSVQNEDGALRFDLIVISAYMILAFFGGLTTHLDRVDNLPLSRRKLLAMFMVPPVLALVAGYGIGLGVIAALGPRDLIQLHPAECCGTFVTLPSARCGIAWDGRVPANEAPWGESHVAWSAPLYRGSRARVYSPFSSSEPPSAKYMAWQIGRATEAVYDRTVPEEEILSRYLETGPSGRVTPVAAGMSLRRDFPGLRARSAGPAFPILMLLVCVPGFLLSALYLRAFRAQRGQHTRNYVLWALLLVLLIVHMAQYVLLATGFMKTWVFEGVFEIAIRKLGGAFPASAAAVWILSGLFIYLAYRTAERAFDRIEVASRTGA